MGGMSYVGAAPASDCGIDAGTSGADAGSVVDTIPNEYYKIRRCKHVIMQDPCPKGASCPFAHAPEELHPAPDYEPGHLAPHWQGEAVSIGIAEHAMFWDLPTIGTMDVVCNRGTCLGNPFATKL